MSMSQKFLHSSYFILIATGVALMPTRDAEAQSTYTACYVPSSGTIYRIREPGLRQQCGTTDKSGKTEPHVEFSWSSGSQTTFAAAAGGGEAGPKVDHGGLTGLSDDDHSQYLLANGVRNSNGFAVLGTFGQGTIPASGFGTRMMWYPGKAAFRVGEVGAQWDDSNIGNSSVAMGSHTRASGAASFAVGAASTASGHISTAMGGGTASGTNAFAIGLDAEAVGNNSKAIGLSAKATGPHSTAIGSLARASGDHSTAIGNSVLANGAYSTALGSNAFTNGKTGAFVYGDRSSSFAVTAVADNQFVVRAQRFWFGNNDAVKATVGRIMETSTGAYLSAGGAWVSSSDVSKKTDFEAVNGEAVLEKLASTPISTWRYKEEAANVRHIGPTAQDFRAAFGLGDTDKAIAGIDADGVSLAAIQALAKRTASVSVITQQLNEQGARIRELETALHALVSEVARRAER